MFEVLENRRLLSGNVAVMYDAATNTVHVHGDNKSNDLVVTGSISAGTYTITGVGGTRVNRRMSLTIPLVGANGSNFHVMLGNGDDTMRFGSVSPTFIPFTANAVSVSTGNGDDSVSFANASIRGGLRVSTGNGDDHVGIDFSDVFNGLSFDTGNGDDHIVIGHTLGEGVHVFSGAAVINAGRGADALEGLSNLHTHGGRRVSGVESIA